MVLLHVGPLHRSTANASVSALQSSALLPPNGVVIELHCSQPAVVIYLFIYFPHGLIWSSRSRPVGSLAVGSRASGSKWTWHVGSEHTNALHRCWQFNKCRSSAPAPGVIRDAHGSNLTAAGAQKSIWIISLSNLITIFILDTNGIKHHSNTEKH